MAETSVNRITYVKLFASSGTLNLNSVDQCRNKLAFHGADTDTDILAKIVARMSACRSACHRNIFRKSRVSDVSARILARMSV